MNKHWFWGQSLSQKWWVRPHRAHAELSNNLLFGWRGQIIQPFAHPT